MSWLAIVRLGLVQACLGSIVVLITSTLNRVMVVEYSLPAMLPGTLVAIHYAVQMIRPRFGYGSDHGGRRTPWIVGGMAVLALGGVLCAVATAGLPTRPTAALGLAFVAYVIVGLGVGACGTSLLVLLAHRVGDRRRAAAATLMWILMIAGFAITSTVVGRYLDPFSPQRLIAVTAIAAGVAFLVAVAAVWGIEKSSATSHRAALPHRLDAGGHEARGHEAPGHGARPSGVGFAQTMRRLWAEPDARGFTLFVFISMLAYSAQELLLEPFAGLVFGYSVGESAKLSGLQHSAVFLGMVSVGVACSGTRRFGSLRSWTIGGCIASALALSSLAAANFVGPSWPLKISVFALGVSNGVFAVAAIGSMMELAHRGEPGTAGVRMGLWGAAQAIAFAVGGLFGTTLVDSGRYLFGSSTAAFAVVFIAEAVLFFIAARFAAQVGAGNALRASSSRAAVTA